MMTIVDVEDLDGTTMTGMIEDVEDLVPGTIGTTIRGKGPLARIGTRESIGGEGLHPRMRTRTGRRRPNSPMSNL
jgi:hypothetical protein